VSLSPWRRTTASVVGALALTLSVTAIAPSALAAPAKAEPVSLFPSNSLTVPDRSQLTGLRVALPTAGCGAPTVCGLAQRLNELDGFDLDPRLAITFSAPVDPAQIAQRITVQEARGGWRTGVDRVVYDPATTTVYAHPAEQLAPGTTYKLSVQGGPANKAAQDTFTTLSGTDGLLDMQRQIDLGGRALTAVGVTPGLRVEGVFPVTGTTVEWLPDTGAATPTAVPQLAVGALPAGSTLVFGSYLAPKWLRPDVTIRQTPTRDVGPLPVSAARLPFVAVLPSGTAPAGG
jgi:hypothetical protein